MEEKDQTIKGIKKDNPLNADNCANENKTNPQKDLDNTTYIDIMYVKKRQLSDLNIDKLRVTTKKRKLKHDNHRKDRCI